MASSHSRNAMPEWPPDRVIAVFCVSRCTAGSGQQEARRERHIGRAKVHRPPRGRAQVGRSVGKARLPERDLTTVLPPPEPEKLPVFVDPSGTRGRRVRLTAYVIGLLLVAALAAVWLSQLAGGPAAPPARPACPIACIR